MLYSAIVYYATILIYAILCYATILLYAILCYATILLYAILCYATILIYAILCYATIFRRDVCQNYKGAFTYGVRDLLPMVGNFINGVKINVSAGVYVFYSANDPLVCFNYTFIGKNL